MVRRWIILRAIRTKVPIQTAMEEAGIMYILTINKEQVWRGILTDETNLTDLTMIKNMLQSILGQQEGKALYRRITNLCHEKEVQKAQFEAKAKMTKAEPVSTKMEPKCGILRRLIYSLIA